MQLAKGRNRQTRKQDPDFSLYYTDIDKALRGESGVDELWDKLTDQQKISISKDQLRKVLFTLPITDSEVTEGGSVYSNGRSRFGIVTKANPEGIISIIEIWPIAPGVLVNKYTKKPEPEALEIERYDVNVEDYGYEIDNTYDLVEVDIYTYYTIMCARAKVLKYGDEVVRANVVEHYRKSSVHQTLLGAAVDSIALRGYDAAKSITFTNLDPDNYDYQFDDGVEILIEDNVPSIEYIQAVHVEWTMKELTGIDLNSGKLYSEVHEGYQLLSVKHFGEFANWLTDSLKSLHIASSWAVSDKQHTIKLGRNYITIPRDTDLTDDVIEQFNIYLAPYGYHIATVPAEVDLDVFVKLVRTML